MVVVLGQYFIYIYNIYPLNADLWSYCRLIKTVIRTIKNHGSTAFNVASTGAMVYGAVASRRDLEDSEDLLERDLDVEELFGREYDHLDERDIIDDEDLFVRDLEAEEFYGREYNLLDE